MVVIVHEELSSKAVELKVATLHEWKCLFKKIAVVNIQTSEI